jgi:hypothetical protein
MKLMLDWRYLQKKNYGSTFTGNVCTRNTKCNEIVEFTSTLKKPVARNSNMENVKQTEFCELVFSWDEGYIYGVYARYIDATLLRPNDEV